MHNSIFEIDMILNNKKYPFIYSYTNVLLLIILIFGYIVFTYNYRTYYKLEGIVTNNNLLKIYINPNNIKYIKNNDTLIIDNQNYQYEIFIIKEELYVDNNYNNYQEVYLKIDNIPKVENLVLKIKLIKEEKKIIYHILDYLERS